MVFLEFWIFGRHLQLYHFAKKNCLSPREMPRAKLILICHSGGELRLKEDKNWSYTGGEAHALDITLETSFDELKSKVAELCNFQISSLSIRYLLPGNKQTLITLSSDKDLIRMIDFYGEFVTAELYITGKSSSDEEDLAGLLYSQEFRENTDCAIAGNVAFRSAVTPVKVTPVYYSSDYNQGVPESDDPDADENKNGSSSMKSLADSIQKRRRSASRDVAARCGGSSEITTDKMALSDPSLGGSIWNSDDDGSIVDVYVEQQLDPCYFPGSYLTYNNGVSVNETIASWKDGISGVGQDFSGAAEFRDVLQKYSIARRFGYVFKKNDTNRASVVCAAEGCSWKIHASWVPSEQVMRIKKMNECHTCGGESWKAAHPSKSWLVSVIKEKLKESPHQKPKDIASEIYRDFGIELNYTQVWRGLEDARVQLQGSHKGAYSHLPWFCSKLVEANPGSVATYSADSEGKFLRLFISFRASIDGFQKGCRPLVFLDSASLRSKYHEMLLTATALDGDNGFFPVAYAVVDVENDDNWRWFLQQLRSAVSALSCTTFVSDRVKGLREMVLEEFQNACHGYSIYHLLDSFMFSLKGPFNGEGKSTLLGHLLSAAHAIRHESFRSFTEQMKRVSASAYEWVMQSSPEFWARALFPGERYDHVTVDVAEFYAEWIEEARDKPILRKMETLAYRTMKLMNDRRVESEKWHSRLTPSMEAKIQEDIRKAKYLKVLFSSETIFEVHDDSVHVVDMENSSCSCCEWKMTGLPCRHAVAVFTSVGKNFYDFCSIYFTTETYRATYSGVVTPVLRTFGTPADNVLISGNVAPPTTSRPPPHKEKRHKAGEFRRTVTCTRCKKIGHNKVTCKEPIP